MDATIKDDSDTVRTTGSGYEVDFCSHRNNEISKCLETLCSVVPFHVAELWIEDSDGFALLQTYADPLQIIGDFSQSNREGKHNTSQNMCKRAVHSKHGFYWVSKKTQVLHPSYPIYTAACFHLPRDNISTDVFVVTYSLMYIKHTQSRLDFMYWMSHATCVTAFSGSLITTGEDYYPAAKSPSPMKPLEKKCSSASIVSAWNVSIDDLDEDTLQNKADHLTRSGKTKIEVSDVPIAARVSRIITVPLEIIPPAPPGYVDFAVSMGIGSGVDDDSMPLPPPPTPPLPPPSTSPPTTAKSTVASATSNGPNAPKEISVELDISNASADHWANSTSEYEDEIETYQRKSLTRKLSGYYRITTPRLEDSDVERDMDLDQDIDVVVTDAIMSSDDEDSCTLAVESHDVNVDKLQESINGGTARCIGNFSFLIDDLVIKREIVIGVDVNEFEDMEFMAEGSNSHIFSAIWHNQPVVIKMLQRDKEDDTIALHEFDIECELLTRIHHPHIVTVLGAGCHPRPFIVLERLKEFSQILDLDAANNVAPSVIRRRVFTYNELLLIAIDLADALNYLHSQMHPGAMVLHRDLKPDNLGMTIDGRLKLFDFGLCRVVQKRTEATQVYEMTGQTGSLRYMAPEVVLNQPYTEKVDVYSYAVVIWTVARNKPPFRGYDRGKHRARVVMGGERPKLENGWPKDFCDILAECWHQDPTKRPSFSQILPRLKAMVAATNPKSSFLRRTLSSKTIGNTPEHILSATKHHPMGGPMDLSRTNVPFANLQMDMSRSGRSGTAMDRSRSGTTMDRSRSGSHPPVPHSSLKPSMKSNST